MEPAAGLAAELNHLGNRETYLRSASEMLLGFFPSNYIAWNELDPKAGRSDVVGFPEAPYAGVPKKLLAVCDDHPAVISYLTDMSSGMWAPRRLSDLVSDRQLFRTRTYQYLLGPLESSRQLTVLTARLSPTNAHCWAMNRPDRDFTDNEVELARRLQPMLRLLDAAYAVGNRGVEENALTEAFGLTRREAEVMHLLGQGLAAVAIGHLLGVSPRTITKHLEHAYAKLGCTNRIDALRRLRGE